jgi:hypothetical protein
MRRLLILLFVPLAFTAIAQDDDYFKPEKERRSNRTSIESFLKGNKFPHHEKLTLEAFGNVSYSQVLDLYSLFSSVEGGFGGDFGVGLRVRLYRKLAIVVGGTYSNKVAQYNYEVQFFSGGFGEASIRMRNQYAGFYGKLQLEFTRKFWMALHFEKTFVFNQVLKEQTVTPSGGQAYPDTNLYQLHFPFGLIDQFDVGLNIGMRFPLGAFMQIKPFIALQVATSGIMRTNAYGPKLPFGNVGEINPSFVHLKLGAIFEIPMLAPKTVKRIED